MGLLSWLKKVTAGEEAGEVEFDKDEGQFEGLDMRGAIDAHVAWKERLKAVIAGTSTEKLDVEAVSADRGCTLGKWIHGPAAAKYRDLEEYASLRDAHARFHACAGGILRDARAGRKEAAERATRQGLRRESEAVQLALVRLYAAARDPRRTTGVLGV